MDSLLFLIESKLGSLPESERKIAEYILKEKKNVMYQRVNEIAEETGASTSAVIRLCKSLGIPGFQEMKIMLARDVFGSRDEQAPAESPDKSRGEPCPEASSPQKHAVRIIENTIDSLKDLISSIKLSEIQRAADLIENASFIYSFGLGLSGNVAFDFYHKMQRLGYLCGYSQDSNMQQITANNVRKGMVCMIVSHSGTTPDIVKAAKAAKAGGASLITITGNRHGDVADLCDVVLLVPFSEPFQRFGASSTRIVQLTIIDILFSELIRRDPAKSMENLKKTNIG